MRKLVKRSSLVIMMLLFALINFGFNINNENVLSNSTDMIADNFIEENVSEKVCECSNHFGKIDSNEIFTNIEIIGVSDESSKSIDDLKKEIVNLEIFNIIQLVVIFVVVITVLITITIFCCFIFKLLNGINKHNEKFNYELFLNKLSVIKKKLNDSYDGFSQINDKYNSLKYEMNKLINMVENFNCIYNYEYDEDYTQTGIHLISLNDEIEKLKSIVENFYRMNNVKYDEEIIEQQFEDLVKKYDEIVDSLPEYSPQIGEEYDWQKMQDISCKNDKVNRVVKVGNKCGDTIVRKATIE